MSTPPLAGGDAAQRTGARAPAGPNPWSAFAELQASAAAEWVALCQETWTRHALARDPLEYLSIGSLMLPAWVSHAMHYCKRLSALTQTGRASTATMPPAYAANSTAHAADRADEAQTAPAASAPDKPAAYDAHDAAAPREGQKAARQGRGSARAASDARQPRDT